MFLRENVHKSMHLALCKDNLTLTGFSFVPGITKEEISRYLEPIKGRYVLVNFREGGYDYPITGVLCDEEPDQSAPIEGTIFDALNRDHRASVLYYEDEPEMPNLDPFSTLAQSTQY